MRGLIISLAAILGLVIGSFLNVLIFRGQKQEKLDGRSRCPYCKNELSAKELIPIFSFIWQRGRCLHCDQNLSWQYPLVESATGICYAVAVWLFLKNGLALGSYDFVVLTSVLAGLAATMVVAVADLRFKIIPNGAVLILILFGIFLVLTKWYRLDLLSAGKDFAASVFIAIFLASIWFFSDGKMMGLGDAKLIFATSLILGFPGSLSAFLFSFWLGGATSLIFLVLKTHTLKSQLPFGPFILLGSVFAYFFSQPFLNLIGLSKLL